MNQLSSDLELIAERIRESFSAQDAAREKALPLCREVIRFSSITIRSIHRHEFDEAQQTLAQAGRLLREAERHLTTCTALENTRFILDAQKEYTEAHATLALATGRPLPTPEEIRVDYAAYLNGLAEAASELRRYLLDGLRGGDFHRGEELLSAMDDIYSVLVTMDFPDSITGGLRRTTDMLRGVMEKTRSDLTLSVQQNRLEDQLAEFGQKLT
ncbi:MAG: haloacid dehalogenase [Dehalococcoidia bacterium]|nr:haloacid dehalogenase [Dehalococcoidia bacterium]